MPESTAPAGGADTIVSVPVRTPAMPDATPISPSEAARQIAAWRTMRARPDEPAPDTAASAAADASAAQDARETNSADTADAAPGEGQDGPPCQAPGEATTTTDPAAEPPPVEPPRSWTAEDKEIFKSLPRETQEKIAARDRQREIEFRRSQNEAAEARKAIDAERAAVGEARQRYEQALPALLATLQEQQRGEFADIRTLADVERLAREDWPRYALWDAQQKKIAAVTQELRAAGQRRAQDHEAQWQHYATRQDQLLLDRVPELADKTKAQRLADAAASVYRDVGFDDNELAALWSGKAALSLRDARLSQIVIDAARWREAKANAAKAVKPNLPPVQRPGTAGPRTDAATAELQALEQRFNDSGTLRDATALRLAQLRARKG